MAEKNTPTELAPPVAGAKGNRYERGVIRSFDAAKGTGFFSRDGGPDEPFVVVKAFLPKIIPLVEDVAGTDETVCLRCNPDLMHVTELGWMAAHRAVDIEPHVRLALDVLTGKVPRSVFEESSTQLAQEALKKAAGDQSVVDLARLREEIAKEADGAKVVAVPGMPEQKEEGRLNEPLLRYLKAKKIPPAMWPETAAEIERLVGKKLAAAVARPRWDDRAKYPELANLSAPLFLKRVWSDQIGADGTIEKELVRQNDRSLMGKVDNYIATRERRRQDAGDAEGLRFITRKTRPKIARKVRPKAARAARLG